MKRFVCTILAALTVFTTLPLNALAAETDIIYPAGTVIDDDSGKIVESTPTEWIEEDTWDEINDPDEVVEIPEDEGEKADFDAEEYEEEINRIFFGDVTEDEPVAIAETDERTPPSRPVSVSIDRTTLTVSSTGKGDIEYSIDSGENWQDSGTFTDLTPGKEYTIIARLKATDTDPATEPSAPLTVSTVPKDTYMVASEEDLETAFAEVSTLPATQERINIRFTKSITVSDTVVLPRLKGRMELFLDLYGFTLTCTKANVPVVQIETRATLGSSYYLDSGVSSEQVRGGHLTASGDGMAILISPNAVAKLRGLTFTCGSTAIENQGDLSVMENVHGGIQNSGYIESINGMKTENGIVNDGTIETIDGCTLGTTDGYDIVYKDGYSEAVPATLINRGIIGTISNTKIFGGKLATVLNTADAQIDALSGENYFRNSNRAMGTVLLNYGTIGCIEDGMYFGERTAIYNFGEISHILDGLYYQYHDGYGTEGKVNYKDYFTSLPEEDQTYLLEHGDPVNSGLSIECLHQLSYAVKRSIHIFILFSSSHCRISDIIRLFQTNVKWKTPEMNRLSQKNIDCGRHVYPESRENLLRFLLDFPVHTNCHAGIRSSRHANTPFWFFYLYYIRFYVQCKYII